MVEIWRDIKDYEGLYQVSNLGRVKSVERKVKNKNGYRTVQENIITPFKTKFGYLQVTLYKDGVKTKHYIHRLVAMTFPDLVEWTDEAKGKLFDGIVVNHKNRIITDNKVENLQWCIQKENNNWLNHNELISKSKTGVFNIKNISKPVQQYTKDGILINEYPSVQEASRQTGIQVSSICNVCNGKRGLKSSGGYIWKYKDLNSDFIS